MNKLVSVGVTTFKFKAYFDVCDVKLGYVARITRSQEFTLPSSLSEVNTLLKTFSMMLVAYSIVKSSIAVVNEQAVDSDLRSILKRPYSQVDNGIQRAMKKNINAMTPEDDTSSRFKPFFPKKK